MKSSPFRGQTALGVILSAALAGCGSSQEAGAPTGGTSATGTSTAAPAPGAGTSQPTATGTAPADAGTPKITEKPAEPTPTPKDATQKGETRKGEVKAEEPPKGL